VTAVRFGREPRTRSGGGRLRFAYSGALGLSGGAAFFSAAGAGALGISPLCGARCGSRGQGAGLSLGAGGPSLLAGA